VAFLVGERELGAGVTRFASGDHPGPVGPGRQVDLVGHLTDHRVVAFGGAVGGDRLDPIVLRDRNEDFGDTDVEFVADHEADITLSARLEELVGAPGRIGPHDHLGLGRVDRQLDVR
jgi:hypothetical protein